MLKLYRQGCRSGFGHRNLLEWRRLRSLHRQLTDACGVDHLRLGHHQANARRCGFACCDGFGEDGVPFVYLLVDREGTQVHVRVAAQVVPRYGVLQAEARSVRMVIKGPWDAS